MVEDKALAISTVSIVGTPHLSSTPGQADPLAQQLS
jgi:hypothetical protein